METIWNRYFDELEASPVQAFGITDYFSCENYFTFLRNMTKDILSHARLSL